MQLNWHSRSLLLLLFYLFLFKIIFCHFAFITKLIVQRRTGSKGREGSVWNASKVCSAARAEPRTSRCVEHLNHWLLRCPLSSVLSSVLYNITFCMKLIIELIVAQWMHFLFFLKKDRSDIQLLCRSLSLNTRTHKLY